MKTISIVQAVFNEEENIRELVDRIRNVMKELPEYAYEHILMICFQRHHCRHSSRDRLEKQAHQSNYKHAQLRTCSFALLCLLQARETW